MSDIPASEAPPTQAEITQAWNSQGSDANVAEANKQNGLEVVRAQLAALTSKFRK